MKKSKVLLIATALFGSIGAFVSCADYESDYEKDMSNQIDLLRDSINGLDQIIKNDMILLENARALLQAEIDSKADTAVVNQILVDLDSKADTTVTNQMQDLIDMINGILGVDPTNPESVKEKTDLINDLSYCLLSIKAFDTLYSTKHLGDINQLLLWHDSVSASVTTAKSALLLAQTADQNAKNAEELAKKAEELAKNAEELAKKAGEKAAENSERIDTLSANVYDKINELSDDVYDKINELSASINEKANEVLASAKAYTDKLDEKIAKELEGKADITMLDDLKKYVDSVDETLKEDIKALNKKAEDLEDMYDDLKNRVDDLEDKVDDIENKIEAIENEVKDMQDAISDLQNSLKKLVSGVLVQSVENPLWGTFNTPFNAKSNMLIALFGETGSYKVDFPANGTVNYIDADEYVDFSYLNPENTVSYEDDEALISTAGQLYLTVNPNTVDFDGVKMALVNSMDQMAPGFDSLTLQKCNDKAIKFGFGKTKAAEDNGFYVADVNVIDPAAAQFEIDTVSLKNAAKEFYHNKTKHNLADLIYNVYDQLNYKLDAYAVKCSWSDMDGIHSVYSNYEIAATAFKPLSYEFLKGRSASIKLPVLPNLESWLINHGIEISAINYDPISKYPTSFIITIPDLTTSDIELNSNPVSGYASLTIGSHDISSIITVEKISGNEYKVSASEMSKLVAKMNEQANKYIDYVNDCISKFNKATKLTQNEFIDRINSYITRINKLIGKDFNDYLQITMLFENGEGCFSQLNAVPGFGSIMNCGETAILYPTSYSAEIIAPAFKKYIAVTKVNGASDAAAVAQTNNANKDLNTVLEGSVNAIEFTPSEAGEYEIAYSALDYFGKITTRKFYIDVK